MLKILSNTADIKKKTNVLVKMEYNLFIDSLLLIQGYTL